MLRYAVKLTRSPATVGQADVEALRRGGFADSAILDICQIVSYYNYVNRLADGLGVELESWWTNDELTVTRADMKALAQARAERSTTPR
jgi:uncharacterized protein YciW